jgi:hypothetical protein
MLLPRLDLEVDSEASGASETAETAPRARKEAGAIQPAAQIAAAAPEREVRG